jgi:hypothetical protein
MLENYNKYHFEIRFMAYSSHIEFDQLNGIIHYQRGPIQRTYKFHEILHYRIFEYEDFNMLVVLYEDAKGKKKKFFLYADKKDKDVQKLLSLLIQFYPSGDLSKLTPQEARSFLHLPHPYLMALLIVEFLLLLFMIWIYQYILKDLFFAADKGLYGIILLAVYVFVSTIAFLYFLKRFKNS